MTELFRQWVEEGALDPPGPPEDMRRSVSCDPFGFGLPASPIYSQEIPPNTAALLAMGESDRARRKFANGWVLNPDSLLAPLPPEYEQYLD